MEPLCYRRRRSASARRRRGLRCRTWRRRGLPDRGRAHAPPVCTEERQRADRDNQSGVRSTREPSDAVARSRWRHAHRPAPTPPRV